MMLSTALPLFAPSNPRDKSMGLIASLVVMLHAFLIVWAMAVRASTPVKSLTQPRRLVVQTLSLAPPLTKSVAVDIREKTPPQQLPLSQPSEEVIEEVAIENAIIEMPLDNLTVPEETAAPLPEPKIQPQIVPKKSPVQPIVIKSEAKKKAPKHPSVANSKKVSPPITAKKLPPTNVKTTSASKVSAEKTSQPDKTTTEQQKKVEEQLIEKARQQQLLTQAQERIAKIAQNRDKVSPNKLTDASITTLPKAITALQIDALPVGDVSHLSNREMSYRDELSSRLKLHLHLPEYGDVKVKLTLERSGKVANVVIVAAESFANRKYIEKTLMTLSFPAFGNNFGDVEQYTFAVTLSNE